jgi:NAD-dependent deacetylase
VTKQVLRYCLNCQPTGCLIYKGGDLAVGSAGEIQEAAALIAQSRYAIALSGAGVSTPSGLPDFRSADSGLWSQVNPLLVASLPGFRLRPSAFYKWIHPLAGLLLAARPNPAHYALAELERLGLLRTVITQNIDGLHQSAGSRSVLELHGHLREATCVRCYQVVSAAGLLEKFAADGQVPRCQCGGVLKPNVILFGEQLPIEVLNAARREALACDLMLVVGTSLRVTPASELPLLALSRHDRARLVIVNHQPTPLDGRADAVIRADVAEALPRMVSMCQR